MKWILCLVGLMISLTLFSCSSQKYVSHDTHTPWFEVEADDAIYATFTVKYLPQFLDANMEAWSCPYPQYGHFTVDSSPWEDKITVFDRQGIQIVELVTGKYYGFELQRRPAGATL